MAQIDTKREPIIVRTNDRESKTIIVKPIVNKP